MKSKIILTISLFLLLLIKLDAQNSLKVRNSKLVPGDKSKLVVELDNSEDVVGFQFSLIIPESIIVSEKEAKLSERKVDHVLYPKKKGDNEYFFICFSMQTNAFQSNEGLLIEIPIEIPENHEENKEIEIALSGVILSSKDATDIGSNHKNGVLKIGERLGPDLALADIRIKETTLFPKKQVSIAWKVKNIGGKKAQGGWIEEISLVSENTNEKYIIGKTSFSEDLNPNTETNREGVFTLPKIMGMDGNIKAEIKLTPNPELKEPEEKRENNTAQSAQTSRLEKTLYLSLDRTEINENETAAINAILTHSGSRNQDISFQLTASKDNQLTLPSIITIKKDESSVAFSINVIDNEITEGKRDLELVVNAVDFEAISQKITIIDNEIPKITLKSSSDVANMGETLTITLETDLARSEDISFNLSSNNSDRWNLPSQLLLSAGKTSTSFELAIPSSKDLKPKSIGKITATANGYISGETEIILNSANIPNFEFNLSQTTISEADGSHASYVTIIRKDKFDIPVTLKISTSINNTLILPESVEFRANVKQQKFNLGVIDNDLVDGDRDVVITIASYIPSCGCNEELGVDEGGLSQTITVLDNDGLALKLKATPSTVKAGESNASVIEISRNAMTDEELAKEITVNIKSDSPSLLELPSTVVIPANKNSVEVSVNSLIDTEKKGDQTARIEVSSEGYSSAFTWLMVTDQNKADLIISEISSSASALAGEKIEIVTTITNQGFAILKKGLRIDYYLSSNGNINGLKPIHYSFLENEISGGEKIDYKQEILLPELAGKRIITAELNADYRHEELSYTNNQTSIPIELKPNYSVKLKTLKKTVYNQGEEVEIKGVISSLNNSSVAEKDIDLSIACGSFVRVNKVTSNSKGEFNFKFQPLEGENGHYLVSASYPNTKDEPQINFNIIGFDIISGGGVKWEIVENNIYEGVFQLRNKTQVTLSDIVLKTASDIDFEMEFTPITLHPGEEGQLAYKITPKKASEERKYYKIDLVLESAEGANRKTVAWYYCQALQSKLIAEPVSINTTMTKGHSRYYEMDIVNVGSVAAENIKVDLPNLEWMKLKTPALTEKLAPYDTLKVILELQPTENEKLNVPITGSLAINPSNGDGIGIPFKIETVSELSGVLQVDVVDEYTYNVESSPHVKGAKVILRHPFSGKIVAEGLTDENGIFNSGDIPEGYYTLNVSAEKHSSYQNNIQVNPGRTKEEKIFLSYQAVSYNWTVKPTEIEDDYEVDIDVEFETNVPKPVIIIEIDNSEIDLEPGQKKISNLVISNHGLISAFDIDITIDPIEGYNFSPMIDKIELLNPKSSVTVPVLIEREGVEIKEKASRFKRVSTENNKNDNRRSDDNPAHKKKTKSCTTRIIVVGKYMCDGIRPIRYAEKQYSIKKCESENNGSGNSGGAGGYEGSGGFGWGGGNSTPGTPGGGNTEQNTNSNNIIDLLSYKVNGICETDGCLETAFTTHLDCLQTFVPGSSVIRPAVDISAQLASCFFAGLEIDEVISNPDDYKNKTTTTISIVNETLSCATSNSLEDLGIKLLLPNLVAQETIGRIISAFKCGWGIGKFFTNCFAQYLRKARYLMSINKDYPTIEEDDNLLNENFFNDFNQYIRSLQTSINFYNLLYEDDFWKEGDFVIFFNQNFHKYKNKEGKISQDNIKIFVDLLEVNDEIKTKITDYLNKWNQSIDNFNNQQSMDGMIRFDKIEESLIIMYNANQYAKNRGFKDENGETALYNMALYVGETLSTVKEIVDQGKREKSVCATVSVRFSQKITMTREAFEGTLTVSNGTDSGDLKEINLDLIITDEEGNNSNHLFQINKDSFLDGSGTVASQASSEGTVIFIPTKEAAPTVAKTYSFGGSLSYISPENNEKVTIDLFPVSLEVNPSPDLVLHYFMQRNILGDDPLTTDIVEPSVPAEMSLMIKNEGFGIAKNVKVESMQPKIMDNEKGMLIDFEIVGSNLNNEPKQMSLLKVDFGNIEAKKSSIGQWWFTSSLLGHFIKYDIKVAHLSSYGNKNLSLIKASYVHELIKSVREYGLGADNIADFLINDIPDPFDIPDKIYMSNGETEEVFLSEEVSSRNFISPTEESTFLLITPSSKGWNYGSLPDPGGENYILTKVVREVDQLELPLDNFWQTHVTLRDGKDPLYENRLHFVDKISNTEGYTLFYTPKNETIPEVVSFENVPEKTTKALETILVYFNTAIDVNSFTNDNIRLIHQGETVSNDEILIGKVDDYTYSINIKALTAQSGYYSLTVQCAGIRDYDGNDGVDGKEISWVQIIDELGIIQMKSDQKRSEAINRIEILFNKDVDLDEFTTNKLQLNGNAINNVIISSNDKLKFILEGLNEYNIENGEYELKIDLPSVTAKDGKKGLVPYSFKWNVDTKLPKVDTFTPLFQGALNHQNITDIKISFNKPLKEFNIDAIKLEKNAIIQEIPYTLTKQNDSCYTISGLREYTKEDGGYKLSVDQSKIIDLAENYGEGRADTAWTVKLTPPLPPKKMNIFPDLGISDNDNITAGDNFTISMEVGEANSKVVLYAITPTKEYLIAEKFMETAGIVDFIIRKKAYNTRFRNSNKRNNVVTIINEISGNVKFKAIIYDEYKNESSPASIEVFLDDQEIDATIDPIETCSEDDYITIIFSDEILASDFSKDILTIYSNELPISTKDLSIVKISDKEFRIENIRKLSKTEDLSIEVDLTKLRKLKSGLEGKKTIRSKLGSIPTTYNIDIKEEKSSDKKEIRSYVATPGMLAYRWMAQGGDIIERNENKVTIRWKKNVPHSITLEYLQPNNCRKRKSIAAENIGTSVKMIESNHSFLKIIPVPNNGNFDIITNNLNGEYSIRIYDPMGRAIFQEHNVNFLNRMNKKINIEGVAPGLYFILIYNKTEKFIEKFIVNNSH